MNRPPATALNVASWVGVAVDAVDHQHHHRGAEQIVVEGAQELGDEDRQEAAAAQQLGRGFHEVRASLSGDGARGFSDIAKRRKLMSGPRFLVWQRGRLGLASRTMLTLPNILTLSRIFAVPILVFLLWRPTPIDYAITFVLYCMVGATDYFDGYLARAQQRISRLGQFLDPIADKIMVAAVHGDADFQPQGQSDSRDRRAAHHRRAGHPAARDHRFGTARISGAARRLDAGQPARQVEDDFPAGRAGRIDPGGAFPQQPWIHTVGLASLWAAAALTLVTGYDYLRIGLKHLD